MINHDPTRSSQNRSHGNSENYNPSTIATRNASEIIAVARKYFPGATIKERARGPQLDLKGELPFALINPVTVEGEIKLDLLDRELQLLKSQKDCKPSQLSEIIQRIRSASENIQMPIYQPLEFMPISGLGSSVPQLIEDTAQYKLFSIPGDGQCLFHAMVTGMRELNISGRPFNLEEIRAMISNELMEKKDEVSLIVVNAVRDNNFLGFPQEMVQKLKPFSQQLQTAISTGNIANQDHIYNSLKYFIEEEGVLSSYIQGIKNGEVWGGAVEIGIACQIFNIQIAIESPSGDSRIPSQIIGTSTNNKFTLIHEGGIHYNLRIEKKQTAPADSTVKGISSNSSEILTVALRNFPNASTQPTSKGFRLDLGSFTNGYTDPVSIEETIDLGKLDKELHLLSLFANHSEGRIVETSALRTIINKTKVSYDNPGNTSLSSRSYSMATGLFLNGGGVKGVLEGEVITSLMEKVNKDRRGQDKFHPTDVFNVIYGTSTGAIAGAGLCIPEKTQFGVYRPKYWPEDMKDIYLGEANSLFVPFEGLNKERHQWDIDIPPPRTKIGGLDYFSNVNLRPTGKRQSDRRAMEMGIDAVAQFVGRHPGITTPTYSGTSVRGILERRFGKTMVDDAYKLKQTKFVAISYSLTYKQDYPIGPGMGFSMVQAVGASAAAPTYFPAVHFRNDSLVDGGITANCPGLYAYEDLTKRCKTPFLVGLGCGRSPSSEMSELAGDLSGILGGALTSGLKLFEYLLNNSTRSPLNYLSRIYGDSDYFNYFDPELPRKVDLADVSQMNNLVAIAKEYVQEEDNRLARVAEKLLDHGEKNKGIQEH